MGIYVGLVILVVISYFLLKKKVKNYKLVYCILIGIALFLIMAFRDITIGTDLALYVPYFNIIKNFSFLETIEFCRERDIEVLFYLIDNIVALFSHNENVYVAVLSFPFIFITSRFIYKYSNNALLGFLIFISLNYYCFSFSALRHTMAAVMLVLSYDYLRKRKLIPFIVFVLLATAFHRSAFVFLIAYPISYMKINFKQIILISCSIVGALLLKNFILNIIFSIFDSGHYAHYASSDTELSLVFFAINLLIYILMRYLYGKKSNNMENRVFLNLQFLSVCFAALTPVLAEMIRISFFFGIFACAGLPNAIECSKYESNKKIYYFVIGSILIFYFLNFTLYNNSLVPYVSLFD